MRSILSLLKRLSPLTKESAGAYLDVSGYCRSNHCVADVALQSIIRILQLSEESVAVIDGL